MKKILVVLVALAGFVMNANAKAGRYCDIADGSISAEVTSWKDDGSYFRVVVIIFANSSSKPANVT